MDAEQGIHDGNERFMEAVRTADRAVMPSLYTSDATILPPNAEAVGGSDAIRDYWRGFFDLGIAESRPLTLEVIPMGEYTLEVGEFSAYREDGSLVDRGRIMVLWKNEDGVWKMHRDTWTAAPRCPTADPRERVSTPPTPSPDRVAYQPSWAGGGSRWWPGGAAGDGMQG